MGTTNGYDEYVKALEAEMACSPTELNRWFPTTGGAVRSVQVSGQPRKGVAPALVPNRLVEPGDSVHLDGPPVAVRGVKHNIRYDGHYGGVIRGKAGTAKYNAALAFANENWGGRLVDRNWRRVQVIRLLGGDDVKLVVGVGLTQHGDTWDVNHIASTPAAVAEMFCSDEGIGAATPYFPACALCTGGIADGRCQQCGQTVPELLYDPWLDIRARFTANTGWVYPADLVHKPVSGQDGCPGYVHPAGQPYEAALVLKPGEPLPAVVKRHLEQRGHQFVG